MIYKIFIHRRTQTFVLISVFIIVLTIQLLHP